LPNINHDVDFSLLNPIELVWKDVKHAVKSQITEQNVNRIKPIVEAELAASNSTKIKPRWQNVFK